MWGVGSHNKKLDCAVTGCTVKASVVFISECHVHSGVLLGACALVTCCLLVEVGVGYCSKRSPRGRGTESGYPSHKLLLVRQTDLKMKVLPEDTVVMQMGLMLRRWSNPRLGSVPIVASEQPCETFPSALQFIKWTES
eukprot:1146916-Pelagomonas_calceolata.AAC.12